VDFAVAPDLSDALAGAAAATSEPFLLAVCKEETSLMPRDY
jgi:hypothetical protein